MTTRTYTIVVSCGTAIATSTHVALKLKEMLGERGFSINTIQCRVSEVTDYADQADLVVTTAQIPFDLPVSVINGLPFLTGVGIKEVIDSIEKELEAGEENQ
ncbi:MAG: PTS sugar transporter subunit IIB [Anaerolineales bacterium]|jgi:PTS system galactitol-specific IIB component